MFKFTGNFETDLAIIDVMLQNDSTIKIRRFTNLHCNAFHGAVIYTEVLVNMDLLERDVVNGLLTVPVSKPDRASVERAAVAAETSWCNTAENAVQSVMAGDGLILVDGVDAAFIVGIKKHPSRGINDAEVETTVYGPKAAFGEVLNVNMGLLRRIVQNPSIKFKIIRKGKITHTRICIAYIDSVVKPGLVDQIRRRLSKFEIDGVIDSGYLQEFIADSPLSPFRTSGRTERPDVVAARLLEGRAAIMVEGSPFAVTVPYLFLEAFQADEDYFASYLHASVNRLLRFVAFYIACMLPALYLALVTFHREMIPYSLLLSLIRSRQGVPFPPIVELIGMFAVFEMLREASVRLPKSIGTTMSIVGSVIISQSLASADIVSDIVIIIVAASGMTSFVLPKLSQEILFVRTVLIVAAYCMGLMGIALTATVMTALAASQYSFGTDFTAYLLDGAKPTGDITVRLPWPMIPGTNAPLALAYNLSMIRTDVLEQTGIEKKPESPEEFQEFYAAAAELGYKGVVSSPIEAYSRYYQYQLHPDDMLTGVGSTKIVSINENTEEMVNKYADEAYLEAYKDIHSDFVKGFIDDDLLVNAKAADPRMQSGQYTFFTSASVGKDTEIIDATRANAPEASWLVYNSVPDAPKYKSLSSGEALQIPVSAANPERVVMWWSWVYSSEEHYNATIYGVEGTDFTLTDGVLTRMTSDEFFYEWMFRIGAYMHFAGDVSQEYIDWFKSFDDDAVMSKVLGFYFDTKATDELAIAQTNLQTVTDESVLGLGMGSDDVEGDWKAFIAALEDAGAQVEIDEATRQYTEWKNA